MIISRLQYSFSLFAFLTGFIGLAHTAYAQQSVIADAPPMPIAEAPKVENPQILREDIATAVKPVIVDRAPEAIEPVKPAVAPKPATTQSQATPETPSQENNVQVVQESDDESGTRLYQPPIDILPAKSVEERGVIVDLNTPTHPALKITPDKSEVIKLDRNAASIIVGNPNHISVLADNAQTLIVVARVPGATHFTALDNNGNIVMQRHVIVASPDPQKKYIRIRKPCTGDDENCQPTQVYYCPDMCHEILLNVASGGPAPQPPQEPEQSPFSDNNAGGEGSEPIP